MRRDYTNYLLIIIVGFFMAALVFFKMVFDFNINSDWFWFLAGLGLAAEGIISLNKQKKFDKKYKIIER